MIEIWDGQTDLRPLAEAWASECEGEIDIEQGMRDLTSLKECVNSDVFVMKNSIPPNASELPQDKVVGAMGITVLDMFFTKDCYSAVRYWYILPDYRYFAKDLIHLARGWSKEMACTKMMICENKLSVPCADFYKAMGFEEFETVYIGDL